MNELTVEYGTNDIKNVNGYTTQITQHIKGNHKQTNITIEKPNGKIVKMSYVNSKRN